jgi:hypothetical protein
METLREGGRVSRRSILQALGLLGMAAAAGSSVLGAPGAALGQGTLGALQPEEKVEATPGTFKITFLDTHGGKYEGTAEIKF